MKSLPEILEGIADGLEVSVRFANGNCFGLADFEMVDESIYQRSDLCVADIVSKIDVEHDVYMTGNKLEFSVNDVLKVKDVLTGEVLFQKAVT